MKAYNVLAVNHLGLGDHIIANAIYRALAQRYELVCVPVKYHNCASVEYMLRDLDNIVIRPVEDDSDMHFFANEVWKFDKLWLGGHGPEFDPTEWDVSFFRQAGVEFTDRWNKWACVRDEQAEERVAKIVEDERLQGTVTKMVFWHDDRNRGICIDPEKVDIENGDHLVIVNPKFTHILFHWRKVIEACDEIHCIASSFAAFIDSIDLPKNPKLFLHAYARPGEPLMRVNKAWEILT